MHNCIPYLLRPLSVARSLHLNNFLRPKLLNERPFLLHHLPFSVSSHAEITLPSIAPTAVRVRNLASSPIIVAFLNPSLGRPTALAIDATDLRTLLASVVWNRNGAQRVLRFDQSDEFVFSGVRACRPASDADHEADVCSSSRLTYRAVTQKAMRSFLLKPISRQIGHFSLL